MTEEERNVLSNNGLTDKANSLDIRKTVDLFNEFGIALSYEDVNTACKTLERLLQKKNNDESDEDTLRFVTGGTCRQYMATIALIDHLVFGTA